MSIMGTAMGALFSGFATGFFTMRMARENLRATQIMLEKVETIRLYSWQQVTNTQAPLFIPDTFEAKYDPVVQTTTGGLIYHGTLSITNVNAGEMVGLDGNPPKYTNDMRLVIVNVRWKTGNLDRTREFRSYIARSGLQDYIY